MFTNLSSTEINKKHTHTQKKCLSSHLVVKPTFWRYWNGYRSHCHWIFCSIKNDSFAAKEEKKEEEHCDSFAFILLTLFLLDLHAYFHALKTNNKLRLVLNMINIDMVKLSERISFFSGVCGFTLNVDIVLKNHGCDSWCVCVRF